MINDDETLAQLSDYLDGAMAPADKSAFEARLAASAELRRELDELRAVRRAIKDLPREQLPDGFLSRFAARRARGDKPREDYVFLPPVMRPVALALSCGLIALVIWDKVTVGPEVEVPQHPQYAAKVQTAAEAPLAQYDFSKRAAGDSAAPGVTGGAVDGKSLDIASVDSERAKRDEVLPRLQEERKDAVPLDSSAAPAAAQSLGGSGVAAARGAARAQAKGRPLEANGLASAGSGGSANEPVLRDRTRTSMSEEERSSRNEQMFGYLEAQKKQMGIAKVLPLDEAALSRGVARNAAPAAPAVAAPRPSMLKKQKAEGKAAAADALDESRLAAVAPAAAPASAPAARSEARRKGRLSPDAGLVFSDAPSLRSSWVLLGFPGAPPSADFANGRLILIKPSATKIVSVTTDPGAVNVVYRSLNADEEADPARDRVAPIPSEPKTVLFFDASPE